MVILGGNVKNMKLLYYIIIILYFLHFVMDFTEAILMLSHTIPSLNPSKKI